MPGSVEFIYLTNSQVVAHGPVSGKRMVLRPTEICLDGDPRDVEAWVNSSMATLPTPEERTGRAGYLGRL